MIAKTLTSFLLLGVAALAVLAIAVGTGRSQGDFETITDSLIVGGNSGGSALGTKMTGVYLGTLTIASGDTSGTLSLTGATSTSRVLVTPMTGNTSGRAVLRATPSTNSVQVVLSGTPGASSTFAVMAIKP